MTIECTACHARYTIADSLVPPQGARVKCRKCGAVISVKPVAAVVTPPELPLVPPTPEPPALASEPAPPPPFETTASSLRPTQPPADQGFERFSFTPSAPASAPPTPPASAPAATEFERFSNAPSAPAPVAPPPPPAEQSPRFSVTPPRTTAATEGSFSALRPPVVAPSEPPRAAPAPPEITPPAPAVAAAPPAPEPPPASAPPAAPAETHRPRISATTVPEGLSPEEMQRHERARRLARVLASDIAIYNREKRERGIRDGNLVAVLGYEIKKSWETYKERVGADFANSTPYFRDALNEIVAEGQKIF